MKKIIVVDDSAVLRTTMQNALGSAGYEVLAAVQGSAGLFDALERGISPDLILLDMFFPDENGIDILRKVKEKYPSIKVLVITALNRAALNREIRQNGCDDILHKPFDLDDLTNAIQRLSWA
ncbi:MAG: response regulator [Elusimicrobiota bacterium]|jgi:CheY-like chemotaxis protein|nr:response regulator [Elusimicrobiota bacterium]